MSRAECLETFLFCSGLSPLSLTNLGRGFNVGVPPLSGKIASRLWLYVGTFIISDLCLGACVSGGVWRRNSEMLGESILMNLQNQRCGKGGADVESGFHFSPLYPVLAYTLLRHDGGRT